ncbi:hypothetical protein FF1_031868 [Malus domestica]
MGRHTVDEQALKVTHDVNKAGEVDAAVSEEEDDRGWEFHKNGKDSKGFYAKTSKEMLLMAYVDIEEVDREELWFLDSGCNNHMCGKKEMFTNLDENFRKSVKLGNNSSLAMLGKGNVHMDLQENGLAIFIKSGKCKIYHPER